MCINSKFEASIYKVLCFRSIHIGQNQNTILEFNLKIIGYFSSVTLMPLNIVFYVDFGLALKI
jgi:hypothetical protein